MFSANDKFGKVAQIAHRAKLLGIHHMLSSAFIL